MRAFFGARIFALHPNAVWRKTALAMAVTAVSQERFARHVGLSRERVRQLIIEGVVELLPSGKLDIDKSRLAYIEHLRARPQRSPAADKLREAKAKEVELRVAERCHELVERDAATEVVEDSIAAILLGLQGMAARIGGRDLALRKRIDDEVYRIRAEAAARLEQHAVSLRETGEAAQTSFAPRVNGGASAP
jgi:hypothetical protein